MYPQTTSLYSATVVDCTTYCREDDDIIVVEFDGEEPGTYTYTCTYSTYMHTQHDSFVRSFVLNRLFLILS